MGFEWETSGIAVKRANHSATSDRHSLCPEFAFKFAFVAQAKVYTGEQSFSCTLLWNIVRRSEEGQGHAPISAKKVTKRWLLHEFYISYPTCLVSVSTIRYAAEQLWWCIGFLSYKSKQSPIN